MRYGTLRYVADILMRHTGQDVELEYTKNFIETDTQTVHGDVQILVDGEVVSGWVNPQTAHDWLTGAVWGVRSAR